MVRQLKPNVWAIECSNIYFNGKSKKKLIVFDEARKKVNVLNFQYDTVEWAGEDEITDIFSVSEEIIECESVEDAQRLARRMAFKEAL